jgi:hypothetical protein
VIEPRNACDLHVEVCSGRFGCLISMFDELAATAKLGQYLSDEI